MHLLLRRTQRDDGLIWSSMVFLLDATLDLTPEENELFDRYDLRSVVVYDSDDREQYSHSATEHFDAAQNAPLPHVTGEDLFQDLTALFSDVASSLWHTSAGITHGLIAMASLRITLESLTHGQHFESESLSELLNVEKYIKESVQYLADYLQIAISFDGSEQLDEY